MKPIWIVILATALASGHAAAEGQKEKSRPAKSGKNVFQKAESSVGDWANRNKVWLTRKKKAGKKKD